jgi:hypothetical protein
MMLIPLYLNKSRSSATSTNRIIKHHNALSSLLKITHTLTMRSSLTSYELVIGMYYMLLILIPHSKQ